MKLGICVNNLGASQLSYHLVMQSNLLVGSRCDIDVIAFYEDLQKPCLPMNFANMQIAEGWGHDGTMIATNLSTASKLMRFPSPKRKFFYVWDLEWLRMTHKHYRPLHAVYGNNELTLVARSEDHARIISNAWNRPIDFITDNFDLQKFIEAS